MALTLRLSESEKEMIEKIKRSRAIKSSSKAIVMSLEIATEVYPKLRDDYQELFKKYEKLEWKYNNLIELLKQKETVEKRINSLLNES